MTVGRAVFASAATACGSLRIATAFGLLRMLSSGRQADRLPPRRSRLTVATPGFPGGYTGAGPRMTRARCPHAGLDGEDALKPRVEHRRQEVGADLELKRRRHRAATSPKVPFGTAVKKPAGSWTSPSPSTRQNLNTPRRYRARAAASRWRFEPRRGCPARRGISRRRSRCDGQALRTIAASLVGVRAASA